MRDDVKRGATRARDETDATRRAFLLHGGVLAAGAAAGTMTTRAAQATEAPASIAPRQDAPDPPTPPALPVPAITKTTIAEAEKLVGVEYTEAERALIVETIDEAIERSHARRALELPNGLGPAQVFDPRLPGETFDTSPNRVVVDGIDPGPLPERDDDIAFAPVTALARWIECRELSSTRLTEIYLRRLKRLGPKIECVVTLTPNRAREQAARADAELAGGREPRSPLHGIPWGAKDLLDTAGIRTTWGATPYRDRVAESDAAVVQRLEEAGAVLIAKLTLGALAYGDIWFDGKTRSPWNLERGSSGSSAGSAAATAAGLVGFAIGTETLGSIVSPCMRCGATGLRPTFGRVPRNGAMALCWSLDKIGAICRRVEDTIVVLDAINGADPRDPSSLDMPIHYEGSRRSGPGRVGYNPKWFERASDLDRVALEAARETGAELVEIDLPEWPYGTLMTILLAEAAAAFEPLTLDGRDDDLVWQAPQAWPNTFRTTRFVPAIEYIQAERFRRQVMTMMASAFERVDVMMSPTYAASLLLITNCTGHPSLTLRCGFGDNGEPHGITLWGRLFDEGTLIRIGRRMESAFGVWDRRPPLG